MKLRSGDVSWYDLTALTFHYETPPLPTRLASRAHALPVWFHCAACAGMFTRELLIPFFLFAPSPAGTAPRSSLHRLSRNT
ncbi:MAG: lipase maturation factor family protein [Opitutaceae bacterium]